MVVAHPQPGGREQLVVTFAQAAPLDDGALRLQPSTDAERRRQEELRARLARTESHIRQVTGAGSNQLCADGRPSRPLLCTRF